MMAVHTRVIGIGQPVAGDDQAGIAVARELGAKPVPAGIAVHEITDPARLVELLGGLRYAILIDAVVSDEPPGNIMHLTPEELAAYPFTPLSSHGLSVTGAIRLLHTLALDRQDSEIHIIGITIEAPNRYTHTLSAPVAAAVPRAVAMPRG